jgi:hypothetical protein
MNPFKNLKDRWKAKKEETDGKITVSIAASRERCKTKHSVKRCVDCKEYSAFCLIRERRKL